MDVSANRPSTASELVGVSGLERHGILGVVVDHSDLGGYGSPTASPLGATGVDPPVFTYVRGAGTTEVW